MGLQTARARRELSSGMSVLAYPPAMSEISAGFTLEFCGDDGKPVASAWTSTGFRLAALPHPGDLVLGRLPAGRAGPAIVPVRGGVSRPALSGHRSGATVRGGDLPARRRHIAGAAPSAD